MNENLLSDKAYLVTLNLKYGSAAKPLKTLAFAQLAAKAIYFSNTSNTPGELSRIIAKLIGVQAVSEDLVKGGLNHLRDIDKVIERGGKWSLVGAAGREISQEVQSTKTLLNGVLERHFPKNIDNKKLREWFTDASADFFGYFGDEWVKSICKSKEYRNLKPKNTADLLGTSIEKHRIQGRSQELVDGFVDFVSSSEASDQNCLMSLGLAMFSAKLVAADVGVDTLAIEELRGAQLLFDTNVLFAISLESNRLSKSLQELGSALTVMGISPCILQTTKDEYKRVVLGRRNDILNLLHNYPEQVVGEAKNPFIMTAKLRGCKTIADYERFFDTLSEPPALITDKVAIVNEDYTDTASIVEKAKNDNSLKDMIQEKYKKLRAFGRPEKKSEVALQHDASLLRVGESLRKMGSKCWVLSLDRTLQACGVQLSSGKEGSVVLSVDALVGMLALNNAGPEHRSENYAPLLANIILNKCVPAVGSYTTEDLHWLLSVNERVSDLLPTDIKPLLSELSHARYEGKSIDNSALQLKINRTYQEKRVHYSQKMEEMSDKLLAANSEREAEKKSKEQRESEVLALKVSEIKRQAKWNLAKGIGFKTLLTVLAILILVYVYKIFFSEDGVKQLVGYVISVTGFIIDAILLIPKEIKTYQITIKNAKKSAAQEMKS